MKSGFTLLRVLLFSILGVSMLLFLSSSIESEIGKVGFTKKANEGPQGCFCHYQDEKLRVGIIGPSTLRPGQSAEYIVWVDKGKNVAAGFNVAAWAGSLATSDVDTKISMEELTHTAPKFSTTSSDTISWKFRYTAPGTTGTDTIYASANNVDNQHNTDGDNWNFSPNFIVAISDVTGLGNYENFLVNEPLIYPNPTKQVASLSFDVSQTAQYSVWIQDMDGRMVQQIISSMLLEKGNHLVKLEAGKLSAGMYHVVIQSGLNKYVKLLQIQL